MGLHVDLTDVKSRRAVKNLYPIPDSELDKVSAFIFWLRRDINKVKPEQGLTVGGQRGRKVTFNNRQNLTIASPNFNNSGNHSQG